MHLAVISLAALLNAGLFFVVTSDDLESAFQDLKKAEPQHNPAEVKPLAAKVFTIAEQLTDEAEPEGAVEKDNWKKRITWVREVELNTEYIVITTALRSPAATTVDLIAMIEKQNPKSKYLNTAYGRYMVALSQTGAAAKIPAMAEKAVAHFPENEDLLLVLANNAMERKQSTAALNYAKRLTASLTKQAKPEGTSAADWERFRNAGLGRGYWIAGIVSSERNQFFDCDKSLRAALPLIKDNNAMLAAALYHLGVANYQLGKLTLNKARVLEGANFSDQSAKIAGPLSQHAYHNAQVMRKEAQQMR